MQIEIHNNPIVESIFKTVFSKKFHEEIPSRQKLLAISQAGKLADGFISSDPVAKMEFKVSG